MRYRLCFLVVIVFVSRIQAQEHSESDAPLLYFKSFSTLDDLPSPTTYNTYQDHYGFLWISTAEGLTRYDGYQFYTYFNDPISGVRLKGACGFYEDEDFNIWVIGPDGTLHRYHRAEDRFEIIETYLSDGWIQGDAHSIIADSNANLWISGYGGLQYYDVVSDSIRLIPLEKIRTTYWPHPEKVRCGPMVMTDQNTLYIGTRKFGLIKYDIEKDSAHFYRYESQYNGKVLDDWINTILPLDQGHLLISDRGNLKVLVWDVGSESIVKEIPIAAMLGLEFISINDIYKYANNLYWMATDEAGLILVDIENERLVSQYTPRKGVALGIESNKVTHVSKDVHDTYWIGTSTLQQGSTHLYNFCDLLHDAEDRSSIPSNDIHDLSVLKGGDILVSTTAGPAIYNINKDLFEYPLSIPNASLRTFGVLGTTAGDMWVSTYPELYHMSRGEKRVKNRFLRDIVLDKDNNMLRDAHEIIEDSNHDIWMVDRWGRLKFINPESGYIANFVDLTQDPESGKFVNILSILDDPTSNRIIVGTDLGMAIVGRSARKVRWIKDLTSEGIDMSRSIFSYLYRDLKGQVWVVIDGLPYKLDPSNFKLEKLEIATRHNIGSVKWIIEEPAQQYWFSSPKGIIKYNETSEESTLYPTENIGGSTWDNPSPVVVSEGKIYFSGNRGLSILDPSALTEVESSPQVRVTSIKVNQKQRSVFFGGQESNSMKLEHHENDIDISMSNLLLLEQSKCQYAYRLLPRDDQWINNGTDNTLELYNLSPDNYTLELKSSNKDGLWSQEITSLQIDITPPWWATIGARLMGLLLIGGGILFAQRYRYHQRIEKQKEIELLRTKISSDLHDDVGTILTGIAMQSELLENFAIDQNKKVALQIADRSRLAMSRMRDTVWAMDARKDSLADLKDRMLDYADDTLVVSDIQYRFHSNIANMKQSIRPNVRQATYLIFKESIANIVKHSDTQEVDVRLDIINDYIELTIKDQGTQEKKTNGSGLGLTSIRSRAEGLNGSFAFYYKNGYVSEVRIPYEGT